MNFRTRRTLPATLLGLLFSAACSTPAADPAEASSDSNSDAHAAHEPDEQIHSDAETPLAHEPDAGMGSIISSGPVSRSRVTGAAQKGPFLNGANLTLSELSETLSPTGRTFQTTIVDDTGAFSFRDIVLDSSIAAIRVDGFFFNEVSGEQSKSQITLSALTDLGARDSANINLVSHLEKARVEYLIDEGASYADAKHQALGEVFAAFSQAAPSQSGPTVSEELDLTQPGAENEALLAISGILLGYRSDAEFSEILANIAGDIRVDGTLDSATVLKSLVSHARALDTDSILGNLSGRYEALGQSVSLPPFDDALSTFVDAHADIPQAPLFSYPEGSLISELFALQGGAELPENEYNLEVDGAGAPMRLVLTALEGGPWFYALGGSGFLVSDFDARAEVGTQTFDLTAFDELAHVKLMFESGTFRAEVYEGNLATPAWSREFTVGVSAIDDGKGGTAPAASGGSVGSGAADAGSPIGPGTPMPPDDPMEEPLDPPPVHTAPAMPSDEPEPIEPDAGPTHALDSGAGPVP